MWFKYIGLAGRSVVAHSCETLDGDLHNVWSVFRYLPTSRIYGVRSRANVTIIEDVLLQSVC